MTNTVMNIIVGILCVPTTIWLYKMFRVMMKGAEQ